MKNFKKISLASLIATILVAVFVVSPKAYGLDSSSLNGVSYVFQDYSHITADVGGQSITFYDKDPGDGNHSYAPQSAVLCKPKGVDSNYGIKLDINGKTIPSDGKIAATLNVGVSDKINCIPVTNKKISVSNPNNLANATYTWSGDNIVNVQPYAKANFTQVKGQLWAADTTPGKCGGDGGIILVSSDFKTGSYWLLQSKNNLGTKDAATLEGLSTYFAAGQCYIHNLYQDSSGKPTDKPTELVIAGNVPADLNNCSTIACRNTGGGTTDIGAGSVTPRSDEDSCNFNSKSAFTWAICPALVAAQAGATTLTDLFEGQLSFTVDDLGNKAHGGQAKVQTAWSTIRIVSSIMLVIVMLVMVLSQATSWGTIDAYTVRKMLPRLVIAVILMQISWDLFAFVILVVNAIGKGLADLMFYPFGGSANMDIGSLLANANVGTPGASTDGWFVGALATFAVAGILGVAAAPAVLGFAVTAFFALVTGLVALMFRKILIITCLIFSPLALLCWILPGTNKYWKLWYDNFTKALMMFPLVVAIIASGRIFAYIAGSQDSGYLSSLLNFIIVMVGFFGPLFILPKTYKWGGSIMNSAGSTIQSTIKPLSDKTSKGFQGMGERWQGKGGKAYNPNAKWYAKGARRIQSGHVMPAGIPGLRGAAERSRRLTIAAGEKWASERNDEAEALMSRTGEKARTGYEREIFDKDTNEYVKVAKNSDGNMIDAAGNVVNEWKKAQELYRGTDRAQGGTEKLEGVAAEKQAFIDLLAEDDTDPQRRLAQAAHKRLIDTHSEIELQGSRIQKGKYQGKRAFEVPTFDATLQSSPQHYSAINNSRPDMAPDVKQSAETKTGFKYATATKTQTEALDKARMAEAISRLTPDAVQNAHYGFYDEIARLGDPALAGQLAYKLEEFSKAPGTVGKNAVGSLKGGREDHVNKALALVGPMPSGKNITVDDLDL